VNGLRLTLAAMVMAAASGCASGGGDRSAKHPLEGVAAPAVDLPAVGAAGRATTAQPGKVVILDFWATHCGPCVKAFPRLQAMADAQPDKLSVVAISEDDERELIEPFLKRTSVKFTVGWDETKAVARSYSVDSMPTTFVLDKRGTVRFVHRGYREDEVASIDAEVRGLLAE
jgi:cytochrome c biogenesis protein CcmG/thiol:disulfide interchange protein DsbE